MTHGSSQDERFMRRALELAARGVGMTRPNPVVGAVLVKGRRVIGEGWHKRAGMPHAEVEAIRQAGRGDAARGATLYVTLEPCCHYGRTPPCTELIIRSGIRRVVIPFADLNPQVSGKGIARLREAGVRVDIGLLAHEAAHLNEPFLTFHFLQRPFVIAKWAMTLDGRLAAYSGDSKWITNETSRRYVHELRARYDAVMVGAGTVLADNPRLDARLPGRRNILQPIRIVVDGALETPLHARCLDPTCGGQIILAVGPSAPSRRIEQFRKRGAKVIVVRGRGKKVDLRDLMRHLRELGIQSVLVEGGQHLLTALFAADLIDRVAAFIAPKIIGGFGPPRVLAGYGFAQMEQAVRLEDVVIRQFGDDVCLEGYVHHNVENFLAARANQQAASSDPSPR